MDHSQHAMPMEQEHVMIMQGIPAPLLIGSVIGIIILSFVYVEFVGIGASSSARLNLIKNKRLYNLFRNRWFQPFFQSISVGVLLFVLYAGFFGSRVQNIAPVIVWTLWWTLLILAVALVGPVFCFACPWDGMSNFFSRVFGRVKGSEKLESLCLGIQLPKFLRNLYPAIILFVVLSWAELGLRITTDPRKTAYLGLFMAVGATTLVFILKNKAFCHWMCPVGRISGIYANFTPVEIRAKKPKTCTTCKTEDCLNGNELGFPCPTGISLKTVSDSTYCTMCTECIKSCKRNNVAFNLRPPAAGMENIQSSRIDEAVLCITLMALTSFHGLSMTSLWESFEPGAWSILKWMSTTLGTSKIVNFSIGMALVMALPFFLYYTSCVLATKWMDEPGVKVRRLFVEYSFSILPIALFYHLAHNLMHLLMEGGMIIPLLGDPLGRGMNLFGLRDVRIGHLVTESSLWYMQVCLILVGHIYGIVVAHRIGNRLSSNKKKVTKSLIPIFTFVILLSVSSLWLMSLDMTMRMGRM